MWLVTNFGFFSVVQKKGDDFLTVRARVRSDLLRNNDFRIRGEENYVKYLCFKKNKHI